MKTPETRMPLLYKGSQILANKGTRLDGEWVWWIDRIRLQKVGNKKLLWAKRTCSTQCKETKNVEKTFDEMLTSINNLERNISELMELKNTTQELCKAYTSFNSWIDQAEERITQVEDELSEIKGEDKIREKKAKRNEQSLQKYGTMRKDLIYIW